MRAVVQRVSQASVKVGDELVGRVDAGLLVLLGVGPDDTPETAEHLAGRLAGLRIFVDADGRMNLDAIQVGAEVLVVSQFTLYGDASHGHRPSFAGAGPPAMARDLCATFVAAVRAHGLTVVTGRFGAHMDVALTNGGPVTMVLTSGEGPWPADAG